MTGRHEVYSRIALSLTYAASIFRLPLSVFHYFVPTDVHASPLTDRSVLLLLVLLQSYRDSDSDGQTVSNPFRDALCSLTDADARDTDTDTSTNAAAAVVMNAPLASVKPGAHDTPTKSVELSYAKLFAAIGRHAPFESSHLLLYTLVYTNPLMLDAAVSPSARLEDLILPLLETLYHARSVDPSRIYMLVIVLLTYTQDAAFVHDAHTKRIVSSVPWYSERYILDVSLGSLLMVLFTRLIFRNITHFQDSFIHLNAFAALSNLARSAENVHVYAAHGIVALIEMLAKKEAQLVRKMADLAARRIEVDATEREALEHKRAAYVEFIRLLLGVVSSCLKTKLLPRNPQLVRVDMRRHGSSLLKLQTNAIVSCWCRFIRCSIAPRRSWRCSSTPSLRIKWRTDRSGPRSRASERSWTPRRRQTTSWTSTQSCRSSAPSA